MAIFVDAGNLWIESKNFNLRKLRWVSGMGIMYSTPIGPISLELGYNLKPRALFLEDRWNLHFSIGVF